MEERLKIVENMVYKLEHLNDAKDREVDAVRQTVRDFLRVFNNDVSYFDSFYRNYSFRLCNSLTLVFHHVHL